TKTSYAIGVNIGTNLKNRGEYLEPEALLKGIREALAGEKLQYSEEEIRQTLTAFQAQLEADDAETAKKASEMNKGKGDEYLAANAKKEGVVVTKSGLQYKELKAGDGASPKATDTVEVHYRGTLTNGKEFDSSYGRGETAKFPVNRVIAGWTEALQMMKAGSKWQVFIPSELAYGERGAGEDIGPNEALVFEIELIAVNPKD
ncbi:MAG: FKBP-type peptidyl-prolyl cis-trans isomerase, partial [Planctomycetia bacterium]